MGKSFSLSPEVVRLVLGQPAWPGCVPWSLWARAAPEIVPAAAAGRAPHRQNPSVTSAGQGLRALGRGHSPHVGNLCCSAQKGSWKIPNTAYLGSDTDVLISHALQTSD